MQINVGDVNSDGTYTGTFKTYALCGYIRDKVRLFLFVFPTRPTLPPLCEVEGPGLGTPSVDFVHIMIFSYSF